MSVQKHYTEEVFLKCIKCLKKFMYFLWGGLRGPSGARDLLLAGLSFGKSYLNGYLLLLEKAEIIDFPQPSAPESSFISQEFSLISLMGSCKGRELFPPVNSR